MHELWIFFYMSVMIIHILISCFKEARSSYRKILTESARKLNAQGSQLGACIEKARPYYEARRLAKEVRERVLSFPKHFIIIIIIIIIILDAGILMNICRRTAWER